MNKPLRTLLLLLALTALGVNSLQSQDTDRPQIKFSGYVQTLLQVGNDYNAFTVGKGVERTTDIIQSRLGIRRASLVTEARWDELSAQIIINLRESGITPNRVMITYAPRNTGFALDAGLMKVPFGNEISRYAGAIELIDRPLFLSRMAPVAIDLGVSARYATPADKPTGANFSLSALSGNSFNSMPQSIPNLLGTAAVHHQTGSTYLLGGISAYVGGVELSGKRYARQYYGAHAQVKSRYNGGELDLRAEGVWGRQPGTRTMAYTYDPKGAGIAPGDMLVRPFTGLTLLAANRFTGTPLRLFARYTYYDQNTNFKQEWSEHPLEIQNPDLEGVKHSVRAGAELFFFRDYLRLVLGYQYTRTVNGFTASGAPTYAPDMHIGMLALQYSF